MCECYTIGGPFIAEDPDCPAHGREARRREAEANLLEIEANMTANVDRLREIIAELAVLARGY